VLQAKVRAAFTASGVTWSDSINIYLKPSKQASQKLFVCLTPEGTEATITAAWRVARLRKGGQQDFVVELFAYIPKAPKPESTTSLHRATVNRIQEALPRVREALEAGSVPYGAATLRYAATAQARLPTSDPVQIPQSATFRQLQHIDNLQRQADTAATDEPAFADIEVTINGAIVVLQMRVADLRRALGLPPYPLCPPSCHVR
jgi:hypothetical protein